MSMKNRILLERNGSDQFGNKGSSELSEASQISNVKTVQEEVVKDKNSSDVDAISELTCKV